MLQSNQSDINSAVFLKFFHYFKYYVFRKIIMSCDQDSE